MSTLADRIQGVGSIINYQFQGTGVITEALYLAGAGGTLILHAPTFDGNKRLAMVGNAIIRAVLVLDGYGAGKLKSRQTSTPKARGYMLIFDYQERSPTRSILPVATAIFRQSDLRRTLAHTYT